MSKILIIFLSLITTVYSESFREFELEYKVEIPQEKGVLSIWVPLPKNTPFQKILMEDIKSPLPYSINIEPIYKNRMLYLSVKNPTKAEISVKLKIRRYEVSQEIKDQRQYLLKKALNETRYIPISPKIKELAQEVIYGKKTTLEKAKALYYHTLQTLDYDKSVPGWGRGDFFYAKEVCKGNCTDFHTYFITLARNLGIPAIFVIGFALPIDKKEGILKGYHCWAGFWNQDRWIYVDISEADKNPKKKDFYFGNLDPYRVAFSIGRDIILNPPQTSAPLNYFIYPYAQIDGKPYTKIKHQIRFKILN